MLRHRGIPFTLRKLWARLNTTLLSLLYRLFSPLLGRGYRVNGVVRVRKDRLSSIVLNGCSVDQGAMLRAYTWSLEEKKGSINIGKGTMVKERALVSAINAECTIGQRCAIGANAELRAVGADIKVGDHVRIAAEVVIMTRDHVFDKGDKNTPIIDQGYVHKPITIGELSWIGRRAILLPGITLGRNVIVAAGAVVTRDVPDFAIVGGVPAKVIGEVRKD
ncbi:MAG: acetyltransferase-like isoleucine patch superfamily enzyme [Neolewinella sp.]|jgi:acetyltransferase-like isoleucine patch superfamily enzyme